MDGREGQILRHQPRLDVPKIHQCLFDSTTNAFLRAFPATILQPTARTIELGARPSPRKLILASFFCHVRNTVCACPLAVDREPSVPSNVIRFHATEHDRRRSFKRTAATIN